MYKEWPVAYPTALLQPYYYPTTLLPHCPYDLTTVLRPYCSTITTLQYYRDYTVYLFYLFICLKVCCFCFLLFRRYKAPFLFNRYSFTVKACFYFKSF